MIFINETKEEFLTRIREENLRFLDNGIKMGWWESVDKVKGEPIPFPKKIKISELKEGANMGDVMFEAGAFTSATQARKNGWNKPLEKGIFKIGKNKRIELVD